MALANPTVNTGTRATTVGIQQARRIVDMRDKIYDYDPDASPLLTVLSRRLPAVRTGNPKYQHLEDQPLPWWDTIATTWTAASGAGSTTFTATNGGFFRDGDLLIVKVTSLAQGYELLKVNGVPSGNTVTVIRNYNGDGLTGGTQAGTPNGTVISIIGNVNAENADSRTIKTTQEAVKSNYTGIMRDPFGASNTLQGSDLYGGKERTRQRKKFSAHHNMVIERNFMFSRAMEATNGTTGNPERTTGGLESYISTNVYNAAGPLTDSFLETSCETLFRYGSSTRLMIASRRAATQLDLIAAGRLQTVPKSETYGVAIKEFLTTHGTLMVTISDVLVNDWAGYAFFVDLESVFKRFISDDFGSREARLRTNIQGNSTDGWQDEYLSEVGLHLTNEATCGYIKGIA